MYLLGSAFAKHLHAYCCFVIITLNDTPVFVSSCPRTPTLCRGYFMMPGHAPNTVSLSAAHGCMVRMIRKHPPLNIPTVRQSHADIWNTPIQEIARE